VDARQRVALLERLRRGNDRQQIGEMSRRDDEDVAAAVEGFAEAQRLVTLPTARGGSGGVQDQRIQRLADRPRGLRPAVQPDDPRTSSK
jgi:hypothetical protein